MQSNGVLFLLNLFGTLNVLYYFTCNLILNFQATFDSLYDALALSSMIPKNYLCIAKWIYAEKRWAIISKYHEKLEWDRHIAEEKKKRIGKSHKVNNKDKNKKIVMSDEDLAILLSTGSLDSIIDNKTSSLSADTPAKKSFSAKKRAEKPAKAVEEVKIILNSPLNSKPYLLRDADVIVAIDIREIYAIVNPDELDILQTITSEIIPPLPFSNKASDNSLEQALYNSLNEFKSSVKNAPEVGIHISVDV